MRPQRRGLWPGRRGCGRGGLEPGPGVGRRRPGGRGAGPGVAGRERGGGQRTRRWSWRGCRRLGSCPHCAGAIVRGALEAGLSPGPAARKVCSSTTATAGSLWPRPGRSLPRDGRPGRRGHPRGVRARRRRRAAAGRCADPLNDFVDRDLAYRGLRGASLVVAVDLFLNDSVSLAAEVVLPAAGPTETDGTFTNLEGRVSPLSRKVTPPGTARPDWMIAAELAERVQPGSTRNLDSPEAIRTELAQISQAHCPPHRGGSHPEPTRGRAPSRDRRDPRGRWVARGARNGAARGARPRP